jgi:TolA-binding protein
VDKFYLNQAFYEVLLLNFTQIFYGMNIKLKSLIISGLILFIIPFSFAQKTIYYTDNSLLFKKAQELYSKKDFSNAYQLFENYIQLKNKDALLSIDAEYFKAMCAYYLENKDAEMQLLQFVNHYPENTRVNDALFHLANLYYKKKKYDDVLNIYQKIEIDNLSKTQQAEYHFKKGYSLLEKGKLNEASAEFYEIKDTDNPYYEQATYYYAHIAYQQKKYETALQNFLKLENSSTYKIIVPYYITHIYFIQNKYQDVVNITQKLIQDSLFYQKLPEIQRMLGESFFHLKHYDKCSEALEKANQLSGLDNQGNYLLGYAYYQSKNYENAAKYFEKAVGKNDSIAQSAWYHLADCYLKLNQKEKAKNAFYGAAQLNAIPSIKEDALFNFAKLSYELEYSPFNETIKAFTDYITLYPKSPRKDEALKYLINAYATTKNYEKALQSIEELSVKTPQIEQIHQRLLYNLAVKYFNDKNYPLAEMYFNKTIKIANESVFTTLAHYWLGEIAYQNKDYSNAINHWKKFQLLPFAAAMKEYEISNYNIGYAYLKRQNEEDIKEAAVSFGKFASGNSTDYLKKADAAIRAGDCFFMQNNYPMAIEYYNKAIQLNKLDVDYALYQKALCLGLLKKLDEKINTLKQIVQDYPKSEYKSLALLEIADTYNNDIKNNELATQYYQQFLNEYPNSPSFAKAMVSLGLIYYAKKDDDKAFQYFDKVVKLNPKGEEAQEVLPIIKKIFESKGQISEMERYFEAIGNPLSVNQVENSLYESAKDYFYNQKNCDKAKSLFEEYLQKFPDGKHNIEAHYCIGECLYNTNDSTQIQKAIEHYQVVINYPNRFIFTEDALGKTAYYLYKTKHYSEALPLLLKYAEITEEPKNSFQAKWMALKSAYQIKDYSKSYELSNFIISNENKANESQLKEAKYIKAVSLYELQQYNEALREFMPLPKLLKNSNGATAYLYIAKIYLAQGNYKKCEDAINELLSYQYTNDEINAEGMLILADAYVQQKDYANAKVLVETILNAKLNNPEIIQRAQEKLNEINRALNENENKQSNPDLFDRMFEEYQQSKNTGN